MTSRVELPAGSTETTSPTPSTCPVTMCPSSGSPAFSGGSRFTRAPAASLPSVVTASVAAETSAVKLVRRRRNRRQAHAVDGDAAADGERR